MQKTLILIPSRLSATRLPGKPLLKINDLSIISHVVKKAEELAIGEVYVATEDNEIMEDIKKNGGKAILTSKNHKTGSDRIFECFEKLNLQNVDYIINLQGDEPSIDIDDLKNLYQLVKKNKSDIGTLAAKIDDKSVLSNKNIVKVVKDYPTIVFATSAAKSSSFFSIPSPTSSLTNDNISAPASLAA